MVENKRIVPRKISILDSSGYVRELKKAMVVNIFQIPGKAKKTVIVDMVGMSDNDIIEAIQATIQLGMEMGLLEDLSDKENADE